MTLAELQRNFSLEINGKVSRKFSSFMCPFPISFPEIIELHFIYWIKLASTWISMTLTIKLHEKSRGRGALKVLFLYVSRMGFKGKIPFKGSMQYFRHCIRKGLGEGSGLCESPLRLSIDVGCLARSHEISLQFLRQHDLLITHPMISSRPFIKVFKTKITNPIRS